MNYNKIFNKVRMEIYNVQEERKTKEEAFDQIEKILDIHGLTLSGSIQNPKEEDKKQGENN